MPWKKIAALFYLLTVASMAISCSKSTERHDASHSSADHAPADWKFTLPPGDPVAGRELFAELECYKCHEIKGENFPTLVESDKGIGPELSQMAGMHPAEFFAESIVNPNAVLDAEDREKGFLGADGKSKMPTYSEVLTVKQLADLAAYLKSLGHANPSNHRR